MDVELTFGELLYLLDENNDKEITLLNQSTGRQSGNYISGPIYSNLWEPYKDYIVDNIDFGESGNNFDVYVFKRKES